MIRYTLRCAEGHGFESWFASAAAYDTLSGAGHLACPDCGSPRIGKAPMAPAVATSGPRAAPAPAEAAGPGALSAPQDARAAMLARLREEIEARSEYVGPRFAAEARAIHEGTAANRTIHGEARPDEARALIEDGIAVAPLPYLPTRKAN